MCPSGRLCAHRSVQINFFRPSKKQHTLEKGVIPNSVRTQLSKVRRFFCLHFSPSRLYLKWPIARTAGKNHRAVRAPSKKKTKNEVQKTKKLQILLSAICFGAGLSQCIFGHSQIRLQTSSHECLLARIPENWITFRKSLKIGNKKYSFC